MFNQIGLPGIVFIIVILMFVFGSKNLPNMGRSIGSGIKEFKNAINNNDETIERTEERFK